MDPATEAYAQTLNIHHFKPSEVPWRRIGQYLWRPIEDGSNTQYRLAVIESLMPPNTSGPVFHFHEMHDEGFYVTKGTVRFHSPGRPDIDCKAGEMLTVPIRLPHKFSNPFDEEAVFINTATPGFYIRYFEYLEQLVGSGAELTPEANRAGLLRFATIPISDEDVKRMEAASEAKGKEKEGN
ncbi:RmlC-like cupin domain-containing protein [Ilyonectria sp. MPI-CAGE-AT-0026]|nr:RmlC-like cupin domain-containing protein [Ilyonectria sp. MPI-CAGE-AT-0026]